MQETPVESSKPQEAREFGKKERDWTDVAVNIGVMMLGAFAGGIASAAGCVAYKRVVGGSEKERLNDPVNVVPLKKSAM
jgi:hypothetical protein